eukprot:CAMPEP_0178686238 /NCGR_PEP_ID=MMETSP0699-20121125/3815_1 /TAXON_ID=265572 /ORGANISM="Extubocellulus spinifer, Strain CCMP396" /LENGTH=248 /DNA_ID=CAMNT_0020331055 /DNA_START=196 /DNA_END=942 /DNA_ORIENTATION=+
MPLAPIDLSRLLPFIFQTPSTGEEEEQPQQQQQQQLDHHLALHLLRLVLVPLIVAGIILVGLPAMFSSRQDEGGKTSATSADSTRSTTRSSQEQDQQRQQQQQSGGERPGQIANLLQYAQTNYESNPTDSLTALLEAMRLSAPTEESGRAAASAAMERVRSSLGDEIADHVTDVDARQRRAVEVVRRLLEDESSLLHQQGREDILRQTMEDGSSVVCSKCGGVVPSCRWRQHQLYWCEAGGEMEGEEE